MKSFCSRRPFFRPLQTVWLGGLLSVLLCLTAGAAPPRPVVADNAPVVIRVSEGGRPGGAVAVYGEYRTGPPGVRVRFEETGDVVSSGAQDPAGQFVHVLLPTDLTGAYTLRVSNDNGVGWGAPVYLNQASPRWLSETAAYPGPTPRLLGRNRAACQYGGSSPTQLRPVPSGGGSAVAVAPGLGQKRGIAAQASAGGRLTLTLSQPWNALPDATTTAGRATLDVSQFRPGVYGLRRTTATSS